MRWAVLLSLSYDLSNRKAFSPSVVAKELRLTRVMLESGCFTTCDINCMLDEVERKLFLEAASMGKEYFNSWQKLLGKAMKGKLTPKEVRGLPFIRPLTNECGFLRCICMERYNGYENNPVSRLNRLRR
jgi:hypothetical protein